MASGAPSLSRFWAGFSLFVVLSNAVWPVSISRTYKVRVKRQAVQMIETEKADAPYAFISVLVSAAGSHSRSCRRSQPSFRIQIGLEPPGCQFEESEENSYSQGTDK